LNWTLSAKLTLLQHFIITVSSAVVAVEASGGTLNAAPEIKNFWTIVIFS